MSASLAPVIKVLFQDDFASDPSGAANSTLWTVETGNSEYIPNTLGAAEPGTELQPNLPNVEGGALNLTMNTYNPTSSPPGTSYLGSDVVSSASPFGPSPGAGIAFTFVAELDTTMPGMALGMFAYGTTGPNTHNEIDFEARTDYTAGPALDIQTNIYDNAQDNSVGSPELEAVPSLTQFGTYTIEWFTNAVMWFVNGIEIRADTVDVPQGTMQVVLDFWGYDGTYATLPPVSSASGTTYMADAESVTVSEIACFASGTRLATPVGEQPVETLAVGDVLLTADGALRPIAWIGRFSVDCSRHQRPLDVWPVRVSANAFGSSMPHRDLWLSPDHAVLLGDALIPIRYLVNGTTIVQESRGEITYWHVALPKHDVLLAEGLPCESYLDAEDGSIFLGHGAVLRLFPDFSGPTSNIAAVWQTKGYAQLVLSGPQLEASRKWVNSVAMTSP